VSIAKSTIEDKLIALMKAATALDGILVFFRGVPLYVQAQYTTFAEVFLEAETTARESSGGFVERVYAGAIRVYVNAGQDFPTITDRVAVVDSYTTIQTLTDAIVELFKKPANRDLAALTFTNGAVQQIQIGESDVTYGIANRDQRDDNYFNFSEIPVLVITQEQIT